jgi:Flp pilus assembly protein TadD
VEAAPDQAKGAPQPAQAPKSARTPQPAAVVEAPAPAPVDPVAETVVEKPAPAAERAEPAVERSERMVEKTDTVVEETETVVERTETVVEEPARVAEEPEAVAAAPADAPPPAAAEPRRAIEIQSHRDHRALAETAARNGNCEQALEHFRYAREEYPDDLNLRLREAETFRQCGLPDVTVELLNELDARSRALEAITFEIAEAHRLMNEPGKAAMAWELRYIHHPTAWKAAARAAEAWLEAGQRNPARWWFEQARQAAPNTPEVRALANNFQSASIISP